MLPPTKTLDSETIVVATHNAHKVPEIIQALDWPAAKFISLDQLGISEQATESAVDFVGNAWIKAGFTFARTKKASLADDSGLEVDILHGAPGVTSARFAGETASDAENVEKLLAALAGIPDDRRRARFVCQIAYIAQDGSQLAASGTCEGRIAQTPRGLAGFGYDPVFIPDQPGDGRTMAELSAAEKTLVSHRGKALAELRRKLVLQAETRAAGQAELIGMPSASQKHTLAVFDFDGTLLDGASPVRLIRRLLIQRILPFSIGMKVAIWGGKYKLRMPVAQEQVRGFIFGGLSSRPADEVHDLMVDLYRTELRQLIRKQGLKELEEIRAQGMRIGLVSASFEPIIHELAEDLRADFYVCTQMEIKDGFYTGLVTTAPPEGINKLLQMREQADQLYGEGNWVLSHAYGDHASDMQILSAALNPIVVDPDSPLKKLARKLDWPIRDWQ